MLRTIAARPLVAQSVRSVSTHPVPITVAYGDGIGPEIMESTMDVMEAAGANLKPSVISIGKEQYLAGHKSGISPESWEILRENKVFLKAPITTPTGGGYKSLNVSVRKSMGLYANVRPCVSYAPFIKTRHPTMDVVIVRENEEDTYGGVEHRQTRQMTQCLKLISQPGCERIVRYAFEYARSHNRKKVTLFVKDNIMKLTDGLMWEVFNAIGENEFPDIERDRMIVDIGAAMLADQPEIFDVIVTLNLYGDIVSDIAAQLTGSVGLGASANIGEKIAMFEAIHGSAPPIAGKGIANPSGLLLAATQMLMHVDHPKTASKIYNAWAKAIEDGYHTADIYDSEHSKQKVGTKDFTKAVIDRLGETPTIIKPLAFEKATTLDFKKEGEAPVPTPPSTKRWVAPIQTKTLEGCDFFFDWSAGSANTLASTVNKAVADIPGLDLRVITNRGVKVWPNGFPETFCTDHWRCRFRATNPEEGVTHEQITELMKRFDSNGLETIKIEKLYLFDGEPGFSVAQGE